MAKRRIYYEATCLRMNELNAINPHRAIYPVYMHALSKWFVTNYKKHEIRGLSFV